jgi:uncharacterized SAM-dependent methyltransferase
MTTIQKEIAYLDKFRREVMEGLLSKRKKMLPKYFYDTEGDKLFQQIMESPEYYPTRSETEIFSRQSEQLSAVLLGNGDAFELIELGAGDAKSPFTFWRACSEVVLTSPTFPSIFLPI